MLVRLVARVWSLFIMLLSLKTGRIWALGLSVEGP